MLTYIYYALIGIAGGVLGGMGMGGGTVLIPLLILMLGVSQNVAQTANVVSFVPMAIITLIMHFKNKLVSASSVLWLIVPAIISCAVGCYLSKIIETELLIKLFGGFLALLSIYQIVCNSKKNANYNCANSTKDFDKKSVEKMIKKSSKI